METTPNAGFSIQHHAPHCMEQAHTHPHLEVNLIRGARMLYETPHGEVWVEPDHITLFWAQFEHQTTQVVGNGEIINLNLPLEQLSELNMPSDLLSRLFQGQMIRVPITHYDYLQFMQWHTDLINRPERAAPQVLEEIATRIRRMSMDGFSQGQTEVPPPADLDRLERMTQFVLERYTEAIRVEDIAHSAGLSVAIARRLFKRYMGMGIHQFVRRMRLAHAHRLLAKNSSSVLTVALECGFSSVSGFYTAFEEVYGVKPGVLRRV